MPRATFTWLLDTDIGLQPLPAHAVERAPRPVHRVVEHDRLLDPMPASALAGRAFSIPLFYPDQATDIQLSQEELGYLSVFPRQRVNQALQVLEKSRAHQGGIRPHPASSTWMRSP